MKTIARILELLEGLKNCIFLAICEKKLNFQRKFTLTTVGLFQKAVLVKCTYVLNNVAQMLQVSKNCNIKYNIIQVKLN